MSSVRRPEHKCPPEIYYDTTEAQKYSQNSRILEVQSHLSERALELLALPDNETGFLLDLGCGSGLSGSVLCEHGHHWVGLDISSAMLDVAREREVDGDLILSDLGEGIPFRAGSFDGAISISTLQWLCNADKKSHSPVHRLSKLFLTLYAALRRGARAVFQFYPEDSSQIQLITSQAMKCGFSGGIVVDYPNSTKAKKVFLVLMTGGGSQVLPKGLTDNSTQHNIQHHHAQFITTRDRMRGMQKGKKDRKKSKSWIMDKKEQRRKKGLENKRRFEIHRKKKTRKSILTRCCCFKVFVIIV